MDKVFDEAAAIRTCDSKKSPTEADRLKMREGIDKHLANLHPYVRSCLDRWKRHTGEKYAIFGHERYSSSVSLKSMTEMSREEAKVELKR